MDPGFRGSPRVKEEHSDGELNASLTDQELRDIRQELGLTDIDPSADLFSSGSLSNHVPTPFDIPLSDEEKKLLEECTVGNRHQFSAGAHTARSASLAEVADTLIKDLAQLDTHSDDNNNYDSSSAEGETYSYEARERVDSTRSHCDSHSSEISSLSNTSTVDGEDAIVEEDREPSVSTSCLVKSESASPKSNRSDLTMPGDGPRVSTSTRMESVVENVEGIRTSSSNSPASSDSGLPRDPSLARNAVLSGDSGFHFHQHKYFVVVAIDFGTTFSGYAFAFTSNPESIQMMRRWEGGDPGVSNQKTPTTLLLRPDGSFHSFGFGARDFYHDLEPDESRKWLYFEKFKMALHTQRDLHKSAEIKAANGKSIKAVTVFSHALKFFKDHVIEELTDQSATQILEEDIQWVITVPAIWRAAAKQFMRTAAYEAGLATTKCPDRILIALEPEAASIFCRKLRIRDCLWDESKRHSTGTSDEQVENDFQGITRYAVVDCGGGTVDLTVHELDTTTGNLKELHKATGGPCGATAVDAEFERLLKQIFGEQFIEQFKAKRPAGWVDLMIAFEAKKRTANLTKTNPLNISLPYVFIDYHKKHGKGSSIESLVKKSGNRDVKWSSQGMLRIAPEAMRDLFKPVLSAITAHIRELLAKDGVRDIKYLFLVGGFAESPLLQSAVSDAFASTLRVIIPHDVGLTILKGAVLFGLDPTVIRVRRATMTYGVGVLNRYVAGNHPRSKLVRKNGIEWCTDVFDKFVTADEPVTVGEVVVRSYAPAKPSSRSTTITIYCTEQEEVTFVTDPGVRKCGQLTIEMPEVARSDPMKPRELQASMEFGDTEIKVSAVDVLTGKDTKATIDFL